MVLKNCKKRHTNLGITWIDYKKTYDMIFHSWILESLELLEVPENIAQFIRKSVKNWQTQLASYGEYLSMVDFRRGIFHGDSLSQLLFVTCMVPLIQILRKLDSKVHIEKWRKV